MSKDSPYNRGPVPPQALILSLSALLIPIVGALSFPEQLGEAGALLWLTALVPAFLLAYYRGWRGVATALAMGMAALSTTQVIATLLDRTIPDILFWVVVAYLAIAIAIGWISELLHRERANVESLALTDLLTHLPNRRHARVFLENEFGAAERGRLLSVVLFDLDDFKEYNDRYGHQAGDDALREFGRILEATTRRMNLSARFGGEEFITVLAGSNEDGALVFAERVRNGVQAADLSNGTLTVSAGVAAYHPSMRTPDELVAAADLALYRAKREGRNRVRVFGRPLDLVQPSPDALRAQSTDPSPEPPPEPSLEPLPDREPAEPPPDPVHPSEETAEATSHTTDYPRAGEEIGRSRPPVTLLPHQLTNFGEGHTVLLVEDEPSVRTLVATYLEREGFTVDQAPDATEGLRKLDYEYDILITDIQLPGPSGNELVSSLKARWPATQVIVMTGFRDAQIAAEALNAGADRYLFKPFGMPELRGHLIDALARRERMLRESRERIQLSEEARERSREAKEAVLKGARALVRAVEVRDPYTRGHSARVASYAVALAEHLPSLPEELNLQSLHLACELHDVGKIGVSDAILNKNGGLTPEEFLEVKQHPRTGRRILEPLLGDEVILAVTGWHHERWDGTGYPDGLAEDAIPIAARIVSVADALDAMTSNRAYRPARSWEEAVTHIREEAGTHFDPALMDPFQAALPTLEQLFQTSRE